MHRRFGTRDEEVRMRIEFAGSMGLALGLHLFLCRSCGIRSNWKSMSL